MSLHIHTRRDATREACEGRTINFPLLSRPPSGAHAKASISGPPDAADHFCPMYPFSLARCASLICIDEYACQNGTPILLVSGRFVCSHFLRQPNIWSSCMWLSYITDPEGSMIVTEFDQKCCWLATRCSFLRAGGRFSRVCAL